MNRHFWNHNTSRFFLSDKLIKQKSFDTNTKVFVRNNSSISSFPIKSPIRINRNWNVSIIFSELRSAVLRNSSLESCVEGIVNDVDNSTNKENFKGWREVGPNISIDLDVNIPSINIGRNINSTDCGYSSTIG